MPYVQRSGTSRGASQSNLLAAYIGAVRRKAGLSGYGMGQDDGSDDGGALMPGEGPTVTPDSLPMPILSDTYSNLTVPTTLSPSSPTVTSTSSVPAGTCVGSGCGSETGIDVTSSLSNIFATLAQGAQAGLKIFQQAEGPTNIGGVLYNPATGQYYNPTTGQVVNASGTSSDVTAVTSLLSSPLLLIGGLALGGILLVSMMGHK